MSEDIRSPLPFTRTDISTAPHGVSSLVWRGDELVDWASGGRTFLLDGSVRERCVLYGYRFDAAVGSPSGQFSVIYERLGTKGLLLRAGEIVRELNRSFYHADVYEYPVCLFTLPDGREVIAHCPDDYCDVVIEDAETGARLTEAEIGSRKSFFHSRLAASSDGRFLLTAGWIWHPCDVVLVWELHVNASGQVEFREPDGGYLGGREIASASFVEGGRLLVSAASGSEDFGNDGAEDLKLSPRALGLWNLATNRWERRLAVSEEVGTLMPIGDRYAVGFYGHPKLFDLTTGQIVNHWPDLQTGRQLSSITYHLKPEDTPPPLALDPVHRRFAVANGSQVIVIQFG